MVARDSAQHTMYRYQGAEPSTHLGMGGIKRVSTVTLSFTVLPDHHTANRKTQSYGTRCYQYNYYGSSSRK